jgi:hypothetical protein
MTRRNATFEVEQVEQLALIACLNDPSWQTSAAKNLTQTESRFAEKHETFFNTIGPKAKPAHVRLHVGFWGMSGTVTSGTDPSLLTHRDEWAAGDVSPSA